MLRTVTPSLKCTLPLSLQWGYGFSGTDTYIIILNIHLISIY